MNKKRLLKFALLGIALIVFGIFLFIMIGSYSMNRMVESEILELISTAQNTQPKIYSTNDIENLPAPVRRYFRYALKNGQEHIRFVRMKTVGKFRRPGQKQWMETSTCQYFTSNPPGMIFDAVMKQRPLWFDVRDKYRQGKGGMFVNLLSGFNVVNVDDIQELNETTFLRWVGEAVMFPTALLPGENIKWKSIDMNSAELTVTDGTNAGTYKFYFNDTGEIVKYESDNRYDKIDGKLQKVGSIAVRSHYREFNGVKIPTQFLIARILPNGEYEEFWKGEITDIGYDILKMY
ncbi:MAG: hypothetical protein EHM45_17705 [Desulfobacteraceae bacterium]|nr:MAG: hypothetical protein EHM45_17705 [Desulfobacteraceae bacterium]